MIPDPVGVAFPPLPALGMKMANRDAFSFMGGSREAPSSFAGERAG